MPKFRKKPVVIEAYQVPADDDTHTKEIPSWALPAVIKGDIILVTPDDTSKFCVKTTEGVMSGNVGDWIIKGVEGELYICIDSVFQKTYEPVV